MTRENLAYKFKGSGHEVPEEKRKYDKPDKRLQKAFEGWLREAKDKYDRFDLTHDFENERNYNRACEEIKDIECAVEQAHALLLNSADNYRGFELALCSAGLFLSAVYSKVSEKNIVYDLDNPIGLLGYRLQENKRLIVTGAAGNSLGKRSEGTIIIYGKCGNVNGSEGLIVNFGYAGRLLGCGHGLSLNFGERNPVCKGPGLPYLDPIAQKNGGWYPVIQRLEEYLDALKEKFMAGKEDLNKAFAFLDELGPNPRKTIENQIEKIRRAEYYEI